MLSGIGIQLPIVDGGHAWAITMFFSLCVCMCVYPIGPATKNKVFYKLCEVSLGELVYHSAKFLGCQIYPPRRMLFSSLPLSFGINTYLSLGDLPCSSIIVSFLLL